MYKLNAFQLLHFLASQLTSLVHNRVKLLFFQRSTLIQDSSSLGREYKTGASPQRSDVKFVVTMADRYSSNDNADTPSSVNARNLWIVYTCYGRLLWFLLQF